jgi:hypothetical protein
MDTVRGVWVSPSGRYVDFHETADAVRDNKENKEENGNQNNQNTLVDIDSCHDLEPKICAQGFTSAADSHGNHKKKDKMMEVDS